VFGDISGRPVPVAPRSEERHLAPWDCGFKTPRGHQCLSLVLCVVCCQVDVSTTV
jgi:hypothetical protein